MTYQETIEYLYNSAPLFQNIGAGAYKEGLDNTNKLDSHFGHPHLSYRTIHVAGTNGKGSVSHTLAAILQASGLKVGLYTSPHLLDFRERIRVNGEMIPKERVTEFVEKERSFFEPLSPSFFELTTALAFKYFQEQKVDVAVIEVGLGGRLDCTNIITPDLSIITNISLDHTQFLGNTLEEIAAEKAGIIKDGVPVVVGETVCDSVANVFRLRAEKMGCSIVFADKTNEVNDSHITDNGKELYSTRSFGMLEGELGGLCQSRNAATILASVKALRMGGYSISDEDVAQGFAHVMRMTGLCGRWQKLSDNPLTICDTGHNPGGMQYIAKQLQTTPHKQLHIVIGMAKDKDISTVLSMLPQDAVYYFTKASVDRGLNAEKLAHMAEEAGLKGTCHDTVAEAYSAAKENYHTGDLIFVGGSTFIVADILKCIE